MAVIIRPHRAHDLAGVIELLEGSAMLGTARQDLQEAIDLIGSDEAVVLVAEADGHLVGAVVGLISGTTGWIARLGASSDQDRTAVSDRLLGRMEAELSERGIHKIAVLVTPGQTVREYLEERGYRVVENAVYLEREIPPTVLGPTALADLGGITIDRHLWDVLKGMDQAKEIIERRVILPLSEPELAERHAVQPPKAVVLFGPPGTGKTTFAKGISSRLEWPFIEIQPSELSADKPEQEARALAQILDRILELPAAVVFVDEVEDLASMRHDQRKVSPRVTNEFLKQIPRFRQASHHLLACATNSIGALDPAFLRPGRFDYILPVGPPDAKAREAIWGRYVGEITDQQVDIDGLVAASEFFTPADIEFAAHKAAQRAFEQ
ncbi:MAG TPA: GNAT family N-acetyltransferase, partial [Actinomycetota bacterium]|nr:GNAT family N-acetyltransferase [Actinomycetota bacterium]